MRSRNYHAMPSVIFSDISSAIEDDNYYCYACGAEIILYPPYIDPDDRTRIISESRCPNCGSSEIEIKHMSQDGSTEMATETISWPPIRPDIRAHILAVEDDGGFW